MSDQIPDVRKALTRLGIEFTDREGELWAHCPNHRDDKGNRITDHHPSWSIHTETGVHNCFSCGYKGNLYTLVRDLRGPAEAGRLRQDMALWTPPLSRDGYRVSRVFDFPRTGPPEQEARHLMESDLALFEDPPDWALQARRIDRASCDHFGVRWSSLEHAWILPLRDPAQFRLMGYQAKGQSESFVRNRPTGMAKGLTLFGFQQALHEDRVVVVESPLDAVLLNTMGRTAMALCGSRVSRQQMNLLRSFDLVVYALDDDEAGRAETERLRRLKPGYMYKTVEYAGQGKDFGEMPHDSIEAVLSQAGV